ncbi:hypothetical protein U1Q18_051932, partial [Sarracenia purpurea var. burkii]
MWQGGTNVNGQDYAVMMSTELLSNVEAAYGALSQTGVAIQNWYANRNQNSLVPPR